MSQGRRQLSRILIRIGGRGDVADEIGDPGSIPYHSREWEVAEKGASSLLAV